MFFRNVFLSPEIDCFFSAIGNNLMRVLGRKKTHVFGNARSKSNARAHLKHTLSPFKHCRERQFRLNETSNYFIQGEGGGRGRGRPLAVGMNQHTA